MKAKQLFFVLVAVLSLLLVGLVGIGYATNILLGSQSAKLSSLRAETISLDAQQKSLGKNKKDIEKYSQLNTIARTVVPQDKDQAEAVREIVNIASQSGISKLSSIIFPTSTLGTATTGSSAALKSTSKSSLTQLTPVKSMPGLYQLEITITQDASAKTTYSQFLTFLSKLEQNRRTAQVSSISVTPDKQNSGLVSFTLIIDEYIKP